MIQRARTRAQARPTRRTRARQAAPLALAFAAVITLGTACSTGSPTGTATFAPSPAAATFTPATASRTPTARGSAQITEAARTPRAAARPTPLAAYPPVVTLAVNALAGELRLPADEVEVLQVEPKEWPNAGLGCQEPGKAYLEAITPGYSILLGARGKQYEYHSDRMKMVVRCDVPRSTATVGATPMTGQPDVVRLAIADLSRSLGLRPEEIAVRQVEPVDWPDSSLGCPQPGRAYLQVITPGYRIVLAAGGRQYTYHGNLKDTVIRCDR